MLEGRIQNESKQEMRLEDVSHAESLPTVREAECGECVFKDKSNIHVHRFRNKTARIEMNRAM